MAIAAFVLSWSPYCFVSIIATIRGTNTLTPGEAEVPDLLAKASVIYNPIVYTAMNNRFRASLLRMIPCCRYFARDVNPAANTPTNSKSREENGNDKERKQSQTEVWYKDRVDCYITVRRCFPGKASFVFSFWQMASNFREECISFLGKWSKPTVPGGLNCTQIINNEARDYASAIQWQDIPLRGRHSIFTKTQFFLIALWVNYQRLSAIKEVALVKLRSGDRSKTIAVHMHYNFWNISLPSSAKQQHEMTKFYWRCLENVNHYSYFFVFLFGIERIRSIFSRDKF